MYIQGKIFLATTSNTIKLITIQDITDRKINILNKSFDNVFRVYNQAGFLIQRIHVDPDFKPMVDIFKDIYITMSYATLQEHVPEIDRAIKIIKERFRALYHLLPVNAILKVMVRCGAKDVVKWLNMFPNKGGVSNTYIPIEILTAKPVNY